MISLRSHPWLVDHQDERNAKMGTRDLSSSSSENVTKRLRFSAIKYSFSTQILSENCKKVVFPRLVVNADICVSLVRLV